MPRRFQASAETNRDGAPVHTALRQTDMAMYWAKAEGRGRYCLFDRTMDEKLQQRVELEAEIAGAIEAGQIVPYYQPLVDLATSKPVGFEVLLAAPGTRRARRPRLSFPSPKIPAISPK